MHDLPLSFQTQPGDESDIQGITSRLIIHVTDNGIEVPRFGIQLAGRNNVKGVLDREVPTRCGKCLAGVWETGAVGALFGKAHLVFGSNPKFSFALGEESGSELGRSKPARACGKGVAADGAAITFKQAPPGKSA